MNSNAPSSYLHDFEIGNTGLAHLILGNLFSLTLSKMAQRLKAGKHEDPKPGTSKDIDLPDPPRKKCKGAKDDCTMDSMAPVLNIHTLPDDVMLEIFTHLTQNELCRISRVCKKWNIFTKSPVLWKEVDVKFFVSNTDIDENISYFAEKLTFNVTRLKLVFLRSIDSISSHDITIRFYVNYVKLNFEKFCMKLNGKCPNLQTLVLRNANLLVDFSSVINLCSKFFSNMKVLVLRKSFITDSVHGEGSEHDGSSKIEILVISFSHFVRRSDFCSISKMPCLKKLRVGTCNLFAYANDFSFLQRLEYLNLGKTYVDSRTFHVVRIHAINLTELFLCRAFLRDDIFIFNDSFLLLKSICLRRCSGVTCKGIEYLLQSCQSLENVYVCEDLAEAWANYPFNTANILGIVKSIEICDHDDKLCNL